MEKENEQRFSRAAESEENALFARSFSVKQNPFLLTSQVNMVKKRLCCCGWFIFVSHLLLAALVCSKNHGNPANDLVEIINNNRTAHKLSKLNDSPGLGCIALQYAELCKGNCSINNTVNCKPSEDDFTEVFAPDCGVELPTFSTITGHIVGCQSKYLEPSLAFGHVLVRDSKALSILRNKSHTELCKDKLGVFLIVIFKIGILSLQVTSRRRVPIHIVVDIVEPRVLR
ncbi:hypothetical protein GBA52_007900 [Prunus armeniaca]|nr:hypothetical protein GBA52_007900 [Prunus armeniaca]